MQFRPRPFPVVQAQNRLTGQTGAIASVVALTVGTSDSSYLVSANVLVTASTTHSFTVNVSYTDEGGTARNQSMNFVTLTAGAAINNNIVQGDGTTPHFGIPMQLRAKNGTTITILTTGTFTSVTYNVEGIITQMN